MIVNYKRFKPNTLNNCQSCGQIPNNNNTQINNNMKEIINPAKSNLVIVDYKNLSQNKLFNNKTKIENWK